MSNADTQILPGWSSITLSGHECDIFEPPAAAAPRFAVIYLHGVHRTRLVSNEVFTSLFAKHNLRVIAPDGDGCWWSARHYPPWDPQVTAEEFVIRQVMDCA